MAIYPGASGGTIGALLRGIQEDKSQGPLATTPEALTSSPIRGMVQQPVMQTEAPESARVVAVRPETTPLTGGESTTPVIPAVGQPSNPSAPSSQVIAPAPVNMPASAPSFGPGPSAGPASSPVPVSTPSVSAPRAAVSQPALATSIRPSGMTSTSLPRTGVNYSVPTPTPTPAPARPQQQNAPRAMNVGGFALTTGLANMASKILPFVSTLMRAPLPLFINPGMFNLKNQGKTTRA